VSHAGPIFFAVDGTPCVARQRMLALVGFAFLIGEAFRQTLTTAMLVV
jgi:hypothetical protein